MVIAHIWKYKNDVMLQKCNSIEYDFQIILANSNKIISNSSAHINANCFLQFTNPSPLDEFYTTYPLINKMGEVLFRVSPIIEGGLD